MKKQKRSLFLIAGLIIVSIILLIMLTRIILPSEIDDIHPLISCPEIEEYAPKVLYVIPKYQGEKISDYPEWCEKILSLNKTLALHGYKHEYKEYNNEITRDQIEESIEIFEDCFGFKPELFKPPHLAISRENKKLLKEYNLSIKVYLNQMTRKVYHCNDAGVFSNKLISFY